MYAIALCSCKQSNNGTLDIYETVNRSTRLAAQGDLDTAHLNPDGLVRPELFQSLQSKLSMML